MFTTQMLIAAHRPPVLSFAQVEDAACGDLRVVERRQLHGTLAKGALEGGASALTASCPRMASCMQAWSQAASYARGGWTRAAECGAGSWVQNGFVLEGWCLDLGGGAAGLLHSRQPLCLWTSDLVSPDSDNLSCCALQAFVNSLSMDLASLAAEEDAEVEALLEVRALFAACMLLPGA